MTAAAGALNVDGQGLSLVPRDAATPEQQERWLKLPAPFKALIPVLR